MVRGHSTYRMLKENGLQEPVPVPDHSRVFVPFTYLTIGDQPNRHRARLALFTEIMNHVLAWPGITGDLVPNIFLLKNTLVVTETYATVAWGCLYGEVTHIPPDLTRVEWPC